LAKSVVCAVCGERVPLETTRTTLSPKHRVCLRPCGDELAGIAKKSAALLNKLYESNVADKTTALAEECLSRLVEMSAVKQQRSIAQIELLKEYLHD
jgi:hypothetical protein